MNFYGHAVVSTWFSRDPLFALGTMLPDFAAMCGSRIATVDDERLAGGIDLHHRTDAVFHRLSWFRTRNRRFAAELRDSGVRRGPAAGAAHVGVELVLDGALADNDRDDGAVAKGLSAAARSPRPWAFVKPAAQHRFANLLDRLTAATHCPGNDVLAERIERTVWRRPLLRLDAREVAILARVLPILMDEIATTAENLLQELHIALAGDDIE